MLRTALGALFAVLALASTAHAQMPETGFTERLTIVSNPAFPESNARVVLTLQNVSLDLDRAEIEWYVGGKLIEKGSGLKEISITLGSLGSRTEIEVVAIGEDGLALNASRIIRPAEVDLLWETDSYVPPFYAGKRLASTQSAIRIEALPRLRRENGAFVPNADIIYTWRQDDGIVTSASGRGKSFATFAPHQFAEEDTISVEATSLDGSLSAVARVQIAHQSPFVILYQDHPLFGALYHLGVTASTALPDIEATFAAIPFFAAITNPNDARLTYSWRVNEVSIPTDTKAPSQLTINAENSDGSAHVELQLTHSGDYLMNARNAWNLLFNNGFGSTGGDLFRTPTTF